MREREKGEREADRQTDRPTDRQRERESENHLLSDGVLAWQQVVRGL